LQGAGRRLLWGFTAAGSLKGETRQAIDAYANLPGSDPHDWWMGKETVDSGTKHQEDDQRDPEPPDSPS